MSNDAEALIVIVRVYQIRISAHVSQLGGYLMKYSLLILSIALLQLSCSDHGTGPAARDVDLILKYGVAARNELNTFNDTFTKDLILDGTITTRLVLAPADFDSIEAHLLAIGLFDYPDTFVVPTGDTVVSITPYESYFLKLRRGSQWKQVYWEDSIISSDLQAAELREALTYIRKLVESKPEYKQLPRARGGYH